MGADIKREDRCIKLGRSNQKKLDAQKYNLDHNIRGKKVEVILRHIIRGVKKHKSTIWKGSFLPETQYKRGQKVKKKGWSDSETKHRRGQKPNQMWDTLCVLVLCLFCAVIDVAMVDFSTCGIIFVTESMEGIRGEKKTVVWKIVHISVHFSE